MCARTRSASGLVDGFHETFKRERSLMVGVKACPEEDSGCPEPVYTATGSFELGARTLGLLLP